MEFLLAFFSKTNIEKLIASRDLFFILYSSWFFFFSHAAQRWVSEREGDDGKKRRSGGGGGAICGRRCCCSTHRTCRKQVFLFRHRFFVVFLFIKKGDTRHDELSHPRPLRVAFFLYLQPQKKKTAAVLFFFFFFSRLLICNTPPDPEQNKSEINAPRPRQAAARPSLATRTPARTPSREPLSLRRRADQPQTPNPPRLSRRDPRDACCQTPPPAPGAPCTAVSPPGATPRALPPAREPLEIEPRSIDAAVRHRARATR